MTSELSTLSLEKQSLISLSNKLKADIARFKQEGKTVIKDDDFTDEDSFDEFGVKDLAKSLWSKAIETNEEVSTS